MLVSPVTAKAKRDVFNVGVGAVLDYRDGVWLVTEIRIRNGVDATVRLARIPPGESADGFGRTWFHDDDPRSWVAP